jgi:hypothetical protein
MCQSQGQRDIREPVRVILRPQWSVQDLLEHVQRPHIRLLPYETSDLRDIIEHSTTLADSTQFGFIVQHQNIELYPLL